MDFKDKYIIARWMYSIGEEFISDAEYASLEKLVKASNELKEVVSRSWSLDPCPVELLLKYDMGKYIREVKVGYSAESIPSLTTMYEVEQTYKNLDDKYTISYKMDGFNINLTYINGTLRSVKTRGRSSDALDISHMKPFLPQRIGIKEETIIIGELQLSLDNFEKLKKLSGKDLISARSSVRSALATNPELLTFSAFDIRTQGKEYTAEQIFLVLEGLGFITPKWKVVSRYMELIDSISEFSLNRFPNNLETDGLVVKSNDCQELFAVRVGAWESPFYEAIVQGFEESFGPHKIGMQLKINPTFTGNSMQTKINITNLAIIVKEGLHIGDPVVFHKISDAIANVDLNMTRNLKRRYELAEDKIEFIKDILEKGKRY